MDKDARGGMISFRMINKSYKWSIHEFSERFGLHLGGNSHPAVIWMEDGFDATAMHCDLTGKHTFEAREAKEGNIRNMCLRYVQKVLAHTIWSRANFGTLQVDELLFLWAMTHGGKPIDVGAHLARHLHMAGNATYGTKEPITICGLITPIAIKAGVDLKKLKMD